MSTEGNKFAAPVFGAAAGLCAYMLGGLYAGAAALLLCSLTAFLVGRFGRIWGFLPAAAGMLTAGILHDRFMAECAFCADSAEYMYTIKRGMLYTPLAGAADSAYLVLLVFCGIMCAVYAAAGVRAGAVFAGALAAAGYMLFGGNAFVLCGSLALAVTVCCFGAKDMRSAVLSLGAAVLALPAAFISLPKLPPAGEVSAAGGMRLYLAEEYEQPHCSKAQYARGSAIMTALQGEGFYPETQTSLLMGATGENLPTEEVKVGGRYVPAGVCAEKSDGVFEVCPQMNENIFRLISRLKEGGYLDCEGLYREYVYSAYGSLTEKENSKLRDIAEIDGTLPLDKKLAAVRSAVRGELSDKNADGGEYAVLTVGLARSCGIAARKVSGIYFDNMPDGGNARLADGERREWAEVYIDGAGWTVFETADEYEEVSPLLPEGASADGEETEEDALTSAAEDIIYTAAPPRTAAEIREEDKTEKPSYAALCVVPAGALIALLAAGRIRAAFRKRKRKDRDTSAALKAWHLQGKQLMELVLGVSGLSPEEMSERAGGLLGERFTGSERAYEKLRFSDDPPDEKALNAARSFYEESRRACRKQGFVKNVVRWLRGVI